MKAKIFTGKAQELADVLHHKNIEGIVRYKLADNESMPGKSFHTAFHIIGPGFCKDSLREYSCVHAHEHDEINLLLSEQGILKFQFELDGELSVQESPAMIFIPAGVPHRAEAISGEGIFVCLRLDQKNNGTTPGA